MASDIEIGHPLTFAMATTSFQSEFASIDFSASAEREFLDVTTNDTAVLAAIANYEQSVREYVPSILMPGEVTITGLIYKDLFHKASTGEGMTLLHALPEVCTITLPKTLTSVSVQAVLTFTAGASRIELGLPMLTAATINLTLKVTTGTMIWTPES